MQDMKFEYVKEHNCSGKYESAKEGLRHLEPFEKKPYYVFVYQSVSGKMVFCSKCKKMVHIKNNKRYGLANGMNVSDLTLECGHQINGCTHFMIDSRYPKRLMLTRCSARKVDEKLQIEISAIKAEYKGIINTYYVDYKISINLLTGKTYLITKTGKHGTSNRKTHINDISYLGFSTLIYSDDICFDDYKVFNKDIRAIYDACIKELVKTKKEQLGIDVNCCTDETIKNKRCFIKTLILINRFPCMTNALRYELSDLRCSPCVSKVSFSKIKQETRDHEIVGTIADMLNFEKETKKILKKKPTNVTEIFSYYFGCKLFKNFDVVDSIITKTRLAVSEYSYYINIEPYLLDLYEGRDFIKEIYNVINKPKDNGKGKQLSQAKTYAIIKDKILASRRSIVIDTIRMYHHIKKNNPELLNGFEFSGSFKELHDKIMIVYRKSTSTNKKFSYSKTVIKNMYFENDNYILTLALNTDELNLIGNTMNICVGSYGKDVWKKKTHIVSIKDKKADKYVACIQLDAIFETVIQAKAPYNKKVEGEVLNFVEQWIDSKNLKIKTCDLQESDERMPLAL